MPLLTKAYLSQPIWSPDGTHIAYYDDANTTFDLWLAKVVPDKNHTTTIQADSIVQLTQTHEDLDADSRACWVA